MSLKIYIAMEGNLFYYQTKRQVKNAHSYIIMTAKWIGYKSLKIQNYSYSKLLLFVAITRTGFTKNNHLKSCIRYANALLSVIIFIRILTSNCCRNKETSVTVMSLSHVSQSLVICCMYRLWNTTCLQWILVSYYRLQRSGKVMFLHLSVILFTGEGFWQISLGRHPPEADNPWADTPVGRQPHLADTPPFRHPLGRHPRPRRPLQRTVRMLLECILVYITRFKDTNATMVKIGWRAEVNFCSSCLLITGK